MIREDGTPIEENIQLAQQAIHQRIETEDRKH
jgi:hypothetical protein